MRERRKGLGTSVDLKVGAAVETDEGILGLAENGLVHRQSLRRRITSVKRVNEGNRLPKENFDLDRACTQRRMPVLLV